ncbi:MAG: DNA repair protein RadC [Anaerolineales bacterium]
MKTLLESLPLRERPTWRVTYRPDSCSLLELLAVVIGGPRQIEIAHDMLDRFGTIVAISRASGNELSMIDGIGSVIAARLRATLELSRRISAVPCRNSPPVQTPDDAAQLLIHRMQDLEQEVFILLLLDSRNRLIGEPIEVYRGTLNSTHIRISEVLRPAIRLSAAGILIAHNHPSGDPTPSPEDIAITRSIEAASNMLDIECLDHLIIGRGRFVSLKSKGLGFDQA